MNGDSHFSLLGEAPRPRTSMKKKLLIASVAALAVVGVVGCVYAFVGNSAAPTNGLSAAEIQAIQAKAGVLNDAEYEFLFKSFLEQFGKTYSGAEYYERFLIFKKNVDYIKMHNENNYGYELAVNQFADMHRDEVKAKHLGLASRPGFMLRQGEVSEIDVSALPASINWIEKKAVLPPKNQQQCGSCWAFSAVGSMEGAHAIKTGELVSLSEQELVDCSGKEGNEGCRGGWMDNAFNYVIKNGGISSEADYPYKARDEKCAAAGKKKAATITGFKDVTANSEDALLAAIAQQPVSVAIEADQSGFQFYSSGVFDGACGTELDHGVLLVGYGTEGGKDYWLVKNSWGGSWGDKGYIKLVRGKGTGKPGQCGIAKAASYPIA